MPVLAWMFAGLFGDHDLPVPLLVKAFPSESTATQAVPAHEE
jgi:hypothetical protein